MGITPALQPPPTTPGGPPLSPTQAIAAGWRAFTANPWGSIGVALVLGAVLVVGQLIPFVNLLFAILVAPALCAGGGWFFLRGIRGENPPFECAFEGFQRWPSVTGALLIVFGVTWLLMLPMFFTMLGSVGVGALLTAQKGRLAELAPAALVPTFIVMALTYPIMIWWSTRTYFTMFTVMEADRPTAVAAVRRSFALTQGSVWRLIGLWLLSVPVALLGLLALCVGLVPALIVIYYAIAHAYEQLRARAA